MPSPIRLLLADPHRVLTDALRERLRRERDLDVIATAATAAEVLAGAEPPPDVLLTETHFDDRGAFDLVAELADSRPGLRVVFLTSHLSDVLIGQAVRLGAGYLLKTEPLGAVIAAVRQAAAGDPPYSAAVAERLRFDFESRRYELKDGVPLTRLTPRQVEMLRLIAGGYSTREIAEAVGMTEKGAESQKYRLMEKVGVRNRVELIRYAIREGLLTA